MISKVWISVTVALALLVAIAGIHISNARAQTTTTTTPTTTSKTADMPAEQFRIQRWALLRKVNKIRYVKFRHPRHFITPTGAIAPWRRLNHLNYWRRVVVRSWDLPKHPLVHRAMSWYWSYNVDCIHHYEGAWNDPNAPYWGGMQADLSFQKSYGGEFYRRWGTADHWKPWAQIVMAYRGWRARGGFGPWPWTARRCGLL